LIIFLFLVMPDRAEEPTDASTGSVENLVETRGTRFLKRYREITSSDLHAVTAA